MIAAFRQNPAKASQTVDSDSERAVFPTISVFSFLENVNDALFHALRLR
jgi:hypothetical protein